MGAALLGSALFEENSKVLSVNSTFSPHIMNRF